MRPRFALSALLALLLLLLRPSVPGAEGPAPGPVLVKRGLVVLLEFPSLPHDMTREYVRQRFAEQLARYVAEMSAGRVALEVELTPQWRALPQRVEEYRISPRNLEVDKGRLHKLIDDALETLPPGLDLSRYDFIALQLGAKVMEYGMVGLCGYPGMLGWSGGDVFRTRSGRELRGGVAIFTSQAHLGTLFHDVAHVLGGTRNGRRVAPCLYDHDLQARPGPIREVFQQAIVNMGYWDPMSCHYYQRELPPPGVSSWTRLRLGWLDPARVRTVRPGEEAEVLLGALNDPASAVAAIRIPLSDSSYYLIENRQPLGFDRFLPGTGVLVMLADDTVAECRHGRAPVKLVNADPSLPHLRGAAFDARRHPVFTDPQGRFVLHIVEERDGSVLVRLGKP